MLQLIQVAFYTGMNVVIVVLLVIPLLGMTVVSVLYLLSRLMDRYWYGA